MKENGKKGKKQGYGSKYYKDLKEYHGEWYDNKREGYGTLLVPNKVNYEGKWKNDEKDGIIYTKLNNKKCLVF